MTKAIVELRQVSKAFSGVQALDRCQFQLLPGEVHALMGENGAGKSTLMKVLAGVYQRDSGEILLDGQPVELPSPRAAQALGIGIVHQELNLMNHLSAAQNIYIGREPRGRLGLFLDEDTLNAQAQAIFDRMNQVVAGLSVSFPTFRYDLAREPELVAELRNASRDISRQLGCTVFPLDPPETGRR